MGIEDLARTAGHAAWIEQALFQVLGRAATSIAETSLRPMLADHANQHVWHADLWSERQPAVAHLLADDLTTPATPGLATLVDRLAASTDALDVLVGVYRVVLPRLVTAYARVFESSDAAVDAPTVRVLTLVLADEAAAWRAGEAAVQTLITDADRAGRAATAQQTYESLIAGAAIV